MRLRKLVLASAGVLTLTACSFEGIYDLPMPGGADLGDHPYTVKAQFRDVLDLVPQSGVKVNEVPVGRVEAITLAPDGWTRLRTERPRGSTWLSREEAEDWCEREGWALHLLNEVPRAGRV